MVRKNALTWRLGGAGLALLAAVAVYCLVRLNPPDLLLPFQLSSVLPGTQPALFGSAPSFFYTLAFALLVGSCATTQTGARLHCLLWVAVAIFLEISQARVISAPLGGWLEANLPDTIFQLMRNYWSNGVFDPIDLLATVAGGGLALALLTVLSPEKECEPER